jgi:hypothetical protein
MSETPSSAGSEGVAWYRLMHIGAHEGGTNSRPRLEELGVDEVHRICNRAWAYSRADFEPNIRTERKTSQWRETCALAGSAAESLMLSAATYTEAVWHGKAIEAGTEPAGMAIAQRYLADTAIETVISVGHRLINFVVRVARTAPDTRDRLGSISRFQSLGASYIPFVTDDQDAWLSLNEKSVRALWGAIPAVHRRSLDTLDDLVQSQPWKSAFQIRAENFHRWRKEHESVVGVDQHSGNVSDLHDSLGKHIGRQVSGQSRRHTTSDGLTERTTDVAGDGVRTVAKTFDAIITDTLEILPSLAGGYTLEIDRDGHNRTIRSSGLG